MPILPLEALWLTAPDGSFDMNVPPEKWGWRVLMAVSDDVTPAVFADAVAEVRRKKGDSEHLGRLRFERWREGRCAQVMHVGPYSRGTADDRSAPRLHRGPGLHDARRPSRDLPGRPAPERPGETQDGPAPAGRVADVERSDARAAPRPFAYWPRSRRPSSLTIARSMKPDVGRSLGQAAHEVRIPLPPVRDVDPDRVAAIDAASAAGRAGRRRASGTRTGRGPIRSRSAISIALAISLGSWVARAGYDVRAKQPLHQPHVVGVDGRLGPIGHARRLVVGALAQPDATAGGDDPVDVGGAAPEGRLDHHADLRVGLVGRPARSSSVASVLVWSSMSNRTKPSDGPGRLDDPHHVGPAQVRGRSPGPSASA